MTEEKPCPHSKERRDSSELRSCKVTACLCMGSYWKFQSYYLHCQVFLNSMKKISKGGESKNE